jgi:hypothetical protein
MNLQTQLHDEQLIKFVTGLCIRTILWDCRYSLVHHTSRTFEIDRITKFTKIQLQQKMTQRPHQSIGTPSTRIMLPTNDITARGTKIDTIKDLIRLPKIYI